MRKDCPVSPIQIDDALLSDEVDVRWGLVRAVYT